MPRRAQSHQTCVTLSQMCTWPVPTRRTEALCQVHALRLPTPTPPLGPPKAGTYPNWEPAPTVL